MDVGGFGHWNGVGAQCAPGRLAGHGAVAAFEQPQQQRKSDDLTRRGAGELIAFSPDDYEFPTLKRYPASAFTQKRTREAADAAANSAVVRE